MPTSNAERQRAFRERQRQRVADLEAKARNVTEAAQESAPRNVTAAASDLDDITARIRAEVSAWPLAQRRRFDPLTVHIEGWVREKLREEAEALRVAKAQADAECKKYAAARKSMAAQITEDDCRFLLKVLDPDRDSTPEERRRAFAIARRLHESVESRRKAC